MDGCYTAQIMKWALFVTLIASAALAQNGPRNGPTQLTAQGNFYARQSKPSVALPEALVPALAEVKAKSRIAVLLPSELSRPLTTAKHAIVEKALEDEYAISLYYELGVGNSGFAAF